MTISECNNCRFYDNRYNTCNRYPDEIEKEPDSFCGEWKAKPSEEKGFREKTIDDVKDSINIVICEDCNCKFSTNDDNARICLHCVKERGLFI